MIAPHLTIEPLAQGATLRLTLRGELDAVSSPELTRTVAARRGQDDVRHLIVDLREVEFLDSTAIHALAALDADARQDGHDTRFVRPAGPAWRPLQITGMADHLPWIDAPEEPGPSGLAA